MNADSIFLFRVVAYHGKFGAGKTKEFFLDLNKRGRYVYIQLMDEGFLTLCEVEVFAAMRESVQFIHFNRPNRPRFVLPISSHVTILLGTILGNFNAKGLNECFSFISCLLHLSSAIRISLSNLTLYLSRRILALHSLLHSMNTLFYQSFFLCFFKDGFHQGATVYTCTMHLFK